MKAFLFFVFIVAVFVTVSVPEQNCNSSNQHEFPETVKQKCLQNVEKDSHERNIPGSEGRRRRGGGKLDKKKKTVVSHLPVPGVSSK